MPEKTSLGATIRVWRDRLSPSDVGLATGWSRRVNGLRREELADLANVSVDYVVRLEQGRASTPSTQVLAALARALQLTDAERDHLYRLAGLQPPSDGVISDHIPPGVQRVLTRLSDTPAATFAADWRLLWWNDGWAAVVGDPSRIAPSERSLVRSCFPLPNTQGSIEAWPVKRQKPEQTNRAVVADLRRASARYPDDRRLADVIRTTIDGNSHFAELWLDGAVGEHAEDRKTIMHPIVGEISVDCDVLAAGTTDLKIVILTAPPGSDDASKIELARISAHAFAHT